MTHFASLLKRFGLGVLMASFPLLGGCDDTLTWQEEVKLLDGRVIVVTQKRRYEGVYTGQESGSVPRESWVTFKLPEFGDREIVWHENLKARVLNLYEGRLYIVGVPPTELEARQYGHRELLYIGFRYENGQWVRIPFTDIPEAIYDTNMLIMNAPPNKTSHVTQENKLAEMRKLTIGNSAKRIDPSRNQNLR